MNRQRGAWNETGYMWVLVIIPVGYGLFWLWYKFWEFGWLVAIINMITASIP